MSPKVVAVLIGLAMVGVGAGFASSWGARLVAGLNVIYARLPGRFQYPAWWHRLIGGIFIGFGILIAALGGALAHSGAGR